MKNRHNEEIREIVYQSLQRWIPILTALWRKHQGADDKSARLSTEEIRQIVESVRALSGGLTGNRELIGEKYLSDKEHLGAYLFYYWAISYAECRLIMRTHGISAVSALDLGCGPGPVTFALADEMVERITACDKSRLATKIISQLQKKAPSTAILLKNWDAVKGMDLPDQKYDLITMGHFINELWNGHPDRINLRLDFMQKISRLLNPDGKMLLFEPALTGTSRDLIALRDLLIEREFGIMGPCLSQNPCPIGKNKEMTCHSEFEWKMPPLVKLISNRAGFKRETLKVSYLVITKKKESSSVNDDENIFTVVSDRMLSKSGRIRYFICGNRGRFSLSAGADDKNKFSNDFRKLKRGDVVKIDRMETRENGFGLTENSIFKIIQKSL
jgi:SAM-dependent methyltransferase